METLLEGVLLFIHSDRALAKSYLVGRAYGVFCSGIYYAPVRTISFLVKKNCLEAFVRKMISRRDAFLSYLDKRLLIAGLIGIFKLKCQEGQFDEFSLECLDSSILWLHVQRMEEEARLIHKTQQRRKGAGSEKLSLTEQQDINVYNYIQGKMYNIDKILAEDEMMKEEQNEDDEIMEFMLSHKREAQQSIRDLHSPAKQIDEFHEFQTMFAELRQLAGSKLKEQVLMGLSSSAQLVLEGILQCRKVLTEVDETTHENSVLPRKIMKVKKRAQPQFPE